MHVSLEISPVYQYFNFIKVKVFIYLLIHLFKYINTLMYDQVRIHRT